MNDIPLFSPIDYTAISATEVAGLTFARCLEMALEFIRDHEPSHRLAQNFGMPSQGPGAGVPRWTGTEKEFKALINEINRIFSGNPEMYAAALQLLHGVGLRSYEQAIRILGKLRARAKHPHDLFDIDLNVYQIFSAEYGMQAESEVRGPTEAAPKTDAPQPGERRGQSSLHCTRSQTRVLEQLLEFAALHFSSEPPALRLRLRTAPLVVGPTGVGKSTLVEEAARRIGAHYIKVTFGDWMPIGGKGDSTQSVVAAAVKAHPRVLLHIDELDKMQSLFQSTWSTSVANDLWNVLDYRLSPGVQESGAASDSSVGEIRSRLWIVGSGTWQDIFASAGKQTQVGFGPVVAPQERRSEASIKHRIQQDKRIPQELLARFASEPLCLSYPDADELPAILESSGLQALAEDVGYTITADDTDWNRAGMRCIKSLAVRLLIAQRRASAHRKPCTQHTGE